MALEKLFSSGQNGTDFTPAHYSEFADSIGKVAFQVIREVTAKNPLQVFEKRTIDNGDTIEQSVVKLVEANGYDFEGTNALKRDKATKVAVRYFKDWKRRTYKQTIDLSIIRKILVSGKGSEDLASKLVAVLGQSDIRDRFILAKDMLKWGTTNASGEKGQAPVLKNLGDVKLTADGSYDYKAILKKAKNAISGMQFLNKDYNTGDIERLTKADDIYIIMPYELKNDMKVDELSGVFNLSQDELEAHIITTDAPDKIVYIVDQNAILIFTRLYQMLTQLNADGLFYNYYLHHDQLNAISPLFDACFFKYDAPAGK